MNLIGMPGVSAVLALLLAVFLHPSLRALERVPSGTAVLAVVALLFALSLVSGALSGRQDRFVVLGVLVVLGAGAYDSVRGYTGSLTLRPGQAANTFEEEGPGGRPLGLRPLGVEVLLEKVETEEALVSIGTAQGRSRQRVSLAHAASASGFRLGAPQTSLTGIPTKVHLSITGPQGTRTVDVSPEVPTLTSGDLEITLVEYFPDFALDADRKPFSRSAEPRNPAALLRVKRGPTAWRVFVIQALPGIHKQEGLHETFALVGVESERALTFRVNRQPASGVAALGLSIVAAALLSRWRR
jgi:hypothetical protein